MLEVTPVGGDARGAMERKGVRAIIGGGVERAGAGVEAGIRRVAAYRRVIVASGRGSGEAHAPLVSACPVGGNAMLARGTSENDVQFEFVGRGVRARGGERPLGDRACHGEAGLRDGRGKGRGGGKGEE